MYCDFHTHLNHSDLYPTWQSYLGQFISIGGSCICLIGVDDLYNTRGIEICEYSASYKCKIICSIGYHPDTIVSQTLNYPSYVQAIDHLRSLYYQYPRYIKAIGECGIDVHRPGGHESILQQKELFALQCDLAQELHLPVVIHTRDDRYSTRDIVKLYPDVMFYRHCRGYDSEKLAHIDKYCTHYMIGYTGIITYPKAESLRECLSLTKLQHIAIETDAPYLAPIPHRGQSNQPMYITHIYDTIADLKNISTPLLCEQISTNFQSLYQ